MSNGDSRKKKNYRHIFIKVAHHFLTNHQADVEKDGPTIFDDQYMQMVLKFPHKIDKRGREPKEVKIDNSFRRRETEEEETLGGKMIKETTHLAQQCFPSQPCLSQLTVGSKSHEDRMFSLKRLFKSY